MFVVSPEVVEELFGFELFSSCSSGVVGELFEFGVSGGVVELFEFVVPHELLVLLELVFHPELFELLDSFSEFELVFVVSQAVVDELVEELFVAGGVFVFARGGVLF